MSTKDDEKQLLRSVAEQNAQSINLARQRRSLTDIFQILNEESRQPVENPALRAVLVFRDISERKRIELERERPLATAQAAQREAEHANRLKDVFLTTASHELRTADEISRTDKLEFRRGLVASRDAYVQNLGDQFVKSIARHRHWEREPAL